MRVSSDTVITEYIYLNVFTYRSTIVVVDFTGYWSRIAKELSFFVVITIKAEVNANFRSLNVLFLRRAHSPFIKNIFKKTTTM